MPEGTVGVGGGEGAAGGVELADVLGEVPAIGVPGTVNLDGQRAGGDGLSGVPGQQPHHRVMTTGEVNAGNLQVAAINVALVQSDAAVDCHLLVGAAAHGIVLTFHDRVAFRVGKCHGAVFRVVDRAAQMSAELYDTCVPKISPANGDLWKYNGQCTKWKFREPQARLT